MRPKSQKDLESSATTETRCAVRHPAWCDLARCTADPAAIRDGSHAGVGGEHRSAPIPLNLVTAHWLPANEDTAWLTEACAPWPCDAYLRVKVGEAHLFMPADHAARVLDALSTLLASACTGEEVTR
jgi:hypothetical protein